MDNLKYQNTILINLIIASIIPFLIWGPFFPDLIVSISVLFFYILQLEIKIIIFLINL